MNKASNPQLPRRDFLKATGLTGVAFALGLTTPAKAASRVVNLSAPPSSTALTPYILIEPTGQITLMNPKAEIGQGTFQSLPALIAEELEVSLDSVTIKHTAGESVFGAQTAGGSGSVRGSYRSLRKVGAAAREMLRQAASSQWNVPTAECVAENGTIIHQPTGRKLTYGQLATAAAQLSVPGDPPLKDPKDFRILGKSMPRPDVPLKSSGKAAFGIDARVPGMVYASVERCAVLGSKLMSFDDTNALSVKGVRQVLKVERVLGKNRWEGVAVIGDSYWAARQGRNALRVKWDHQGLERFNTIDFEQQLRELANSEGVTGRDRGEFSKAFAEAPTQLESLYETPMVSHSTMEPMNATAHWQDGKVTVWTSSQGADSVKREVAQVLGISRDDVTVNLLFTGGGFGRRLTQDYATEAALLSKAVGKPVKVIWTREDDTQLGPFRPMTFSAMRGALSAEGKVVALQHKVIAPAIDATMRENYNRNKADATMLEGTGDQAYQIPNLNTRYVFADLHIPLTFWRAVTSTTTAFAHECFIDEMAVKAGQDPLAFRLAMLPDDSDAKRVLRKLSEVSGWGKPLPSGWGRGVAQWEFFAGLAAQVVEVSKQPGGGVRVEKVYCVIDLGTVVNPDMVKAQTEGCVAMALTAATKAGITFENGQMVQANFDTNPLLRIHEMPPVVVHILADGGPKIKGVGEPGLPPLAPALANAIFAATGKRIRRLPINLEAV